MVPSTSTSAASSRSISPIGGDRRPSSSSSSSSSKGVDLRSYFADCDGESASSKRKSRAKLPKRQRAPARRPAVRPPISRAGSHTKKPTASTPHDDDDDGEGEDDGSWEAQAWQKLVARQRTQEEAVRRAIIARDAVGVPDLKKWLDSEDTCTMPEPSLGVRIRNEAASS